MTGHFRLADLVRVALAEDVGSGDWTTQWTVPAEKHAQGEVVAKAAGVVAGLDAAVETFRQVDAELRIELLCANGDAVSVGDTVLRVNGSARGIFTAERVSLNLLQRLSGVATLTRAYVDAVKGTGARVIDTRKTTPGMRALEKAAVRAGGGANHRFGLDDMVLIKENHIAAAGGIGAAVEAVHRANSRGLPVEVETTDLEEVEEALSLRVDRIMFDNMPVPLLRDAVARVRSHPGHHPETEASGGITLETIRAVGETGVDFISVGALTHSVPALDLSLRLRGIEEA
jgi:nicotinate-nucleotide pyrophosphorylase (carboxylating)